MPKQLEVRYRWSFLDFEKRAEIFDGVRWMRPSKKASNLQLEADAIFERTKIFIDGMTTAHGS